MDRGILKKYAEVVIKIGVNVQENQYVVIIADIIHCEFVRILTKVAYENGAKEVIVDWSDQIISYERYLYSNNSVLDKVHKWRVKFFDDFDRENACYIGINSSNPYIFNDIPIDKLNHSKMAYNKFLSNHKSLMNQLKMQSVIIDLPSEVWAKKMFPDIPVSKAYKILCEIFIKTNRLDKANPVEEWKKIVDNIIERTNYLNSLKIKRLNFQNTLGTNFFIELPKKHIWIGGSVNSRLNVRFTPNIPTEEVFTAPNKFCVNGKIIVTRPIIFRGKQIENIEFTFKDGAVEEYDAKCNKDTLKELLNMDNGSRYMGEIAIVSKKTRTLYGEILFQNILYDENVASHFALGRAYTNCLDSFETLSETEKENIEINNSTIHIDFSFGTEDLIITAIVEDNRQISLDI